jgi:hypothetical protein
MERRSKHVKVIPTVVVALELKISIIPNETP